MFLSLIISSLSLLILCNSYYLSYLICVVWQSSIGLCRKKKLLCFFIISRTIGKILSNEHFVQWLEAMRMELYLSLAIHFVVLMSQIQWFWNYLSSFFLLLIKASRAIQIFPYLNTFHWVWILMVHIFLSSSFFSLWFWFPLWFRIFFFKQHIFISKKLIFWWLYPFYLYVELLLENGVRDVSPLLEFIFPLWPRAWLIFLSAS